MGKIKIVVSDQQPFMIDGIIDFSDIILIYMRLLGAIKI